MEVFYSVVYSAIYGFLCSAINTIFMVLNLFLRCFFVAYKTIKISNADKLEIGLFFKEENNLREAIFVFIKIIAFSVGFAVLSYVTIDGIIRIYMLAICFASFYLSKILFFDRAINVFKKLITAIICFLYSLFARFAKKQKTNLKIT